MPPRKVPFNSRVDHSGGPDACWPWLGPRLPKGYGIHSRDGKAVYAHRVALEEALGRPLARGEWALHSCDNPPCCNPAHLRPGTPRDNTRDMFERGRQASPRVTEPQAREMRELRARGVHPDDLRERFGVSASHVSDVLAHRTWQGAGGPGPAYPRCAPRREVWFKASPEAVREIRDRRLHGEGICALARAYGLSDSTVSRICSGQRRSVPEAVVPDPNTGADIWSGRGVFHPNSLLSRVVAYIEAHGPCRASDVVHGLDSEGGQREAVAVYRAIANARRHRRVRRVERGVYVGTGRPQAADGAVSGGCLRQAGRRMAAEGCSDG